MRTAVYTGTRNVYGDMETACKSLLYHKGADRVVFLIEDDEFPEALPDVVQTINVSGQTFFRHDGPNFSSRWTYMVLMKAAVPLMDIGRRVLVLDIDTIVDGNIDALWRLPYGPLYMALEVGRSGEYYNAGVMLMDTDGLRHEAEEIVRLLNERHFTFNEQDAINEVMHGRIDALPPEYNVSNWTVTPAGKPNIIHYAAVRRWQSEPAWQRYASMAWADAMRGAE